MTHVRTTILRNGRKEPALAPLILSASRRTDIPAFFAEQFFADLDRGWFEVPNPYNRRISFLSTERLRCVVFWTRDPSPLFTLLPRLERAGYYFLITITDYVREGWEPGMAGTDTRIGHFLKLSEKIGPERCVWRYDPIILSDRLDTVETADRIDRIARNLRGATKNLVFSFGDIGEYRNVARRMSGTGGRTPDAAERSLIAAEIGKSCSRNGMTAQTCAETEDFSGDGIIRDGCIGRRLLLQACPEDSVLASRLREEGPGLKDPSQRKDCLCVPSRDIGIYATCPAGCRYCYAGGRKG